MIRAIFNLIFLVGVGTAFWGSMAILSVLISPSGKLAYGCGRAWSWMLTALAGVKIEAEGLKNLNIEQPMVYLTNHRSHYDIPIIIRTLPVRVHFVAKKELSKIPIFGFSLKVLKMIYIDRTDPEAARQSLADAAQLVREGRNVLMFPEGTRSKDGKNLNPYKKGGFHLVLQAGVPIQPLVIMGTEKVAAKHTLRIRKGNVTLRLGKPIPVTEDSTIDSLMEATRSEMQRLLDLGPLN